MTAHAAQGQTFSKGCIVDLEIGGKANPLAAYVGLTRITDLERLLILRPFRKEPFQKRVGYGRDLLMKHLRHEEIDWKEVEDMFMPRKQCGGCNFSKYHDQFSKMQLSRKSLPSFCKECVLARVRAGTPLQCTFCTVWKPESEFGEGERGYNRDHRRVCRTCVPKYACGQCGEHLCREKFSSLRMWERAMGLHGVSAQTTARCLACSINVEGEMKRGPKGYWKCVKCGVRKPHASFASNPRTGNHNLRECDECSSPHNVTEQVRKSEDVCNATRVGERVPESGGKEHPSSVTHQHTQHNDATFRCHFCTKLKTKQDFSREQFKKGDQRICKTCISGHLKRWQAPGGKWKSCMPNK